ncbi:glycosyltransferase family 2 protein [Enterococcus hulanensis]|uniref:glycosyltransferase family A protein n=1 Tax=Enterococcus hulanensis TaxID=2559929 RepID=UPI001A90C054|nr:glycosyltransferase family A protein [Enterococcus hulanensis]MBO0459362.1 glycosyltransferase family 2 protein [Enterococcus hulanensis]
MRMEVLIATMKRNSLDFLDEMNIKTDSIIVNQLGKIQLNSNEYKGNKLTIKNSLEKGLSKSRNLALSLSTADICLIADDDIKYVPDYEKIILDTYNEYPEADIIAFQVDRVGGERAKLFRSTMHWENRFSLFKISSVEISFKRKSIEQKKLSFNELIGAGTKFGQGEESVFLTDAYNNGLKILYVPIKIGETDISDSSWFTGYDIDYFNAKGVSFYLMNPRWYSIFFIQFIIRKYKMYRKNITPFSAYRAMLEGKRKYIEASRGEKND